MTVKIIHTADTHLRTDERFDIQTPEDLFNTFKKIVCDTKHHLSGADESAIVHTGDLFDNPDPPEHLVNRVIETINECTEEVDNPTHFLFIAGNHDREGQATPALDRVTNESDAEYLNRSPTIIGNNEIALYGVHEYENDKLFAGDFSFETPPQDTRPALCIHSTVGKDGTQKKVNNVQTDISIPQLNNLVSFQWEMILCGHIHKSCSHTLDGTFRCYAGAPERVRENLKDTKPGTVNLIEIPTRDSDGSWESKHVATDSRPWIEQEHDITDEIEPKDIADEVFSEWKTYIHDEFPRLKNEMKIPYDKNNIRRPTIDVELHGRGKSDVPTSFASTVVDKLKEWGQAHAIKVKYDVEDEDGPPSAVIASGNVGRLGPEGRHR